MIGFFLLCLLFIAVFMEKPMTVVWILSNKWNKIKFLVWPMWHCHLFRGRAFCCTVPILQPATRGSYRCFVLKCKPELEIAFMLLHVLVLIFLFICTILMWWKKSIHHYFFWSWSLTKLLKQHYTLYFCTINYLLLLYYYYFLLKEKITIKWPKNCFVRRKKLCWNVTNQFRCYSCIYDVYMVCYLFILIFVYISWLVGNCCELLYLLEVVHSIHVGLYVKTGDEN